MTIIEGMSMGVPCVAFKNSGPEEIIDDGVDGYLIDKYNVDLFVDRIIAILSANNYIDMSKCALEKAKQFDINTMGNAFSEELKKVLTK